MKVIGLRRAIVSEIATLAEMTMAWLTIQFLRGTP